MKRRILLVGATLLIIVGLFLLVKFIAGIVAPKGRGGLQVTTNIKAQIYLDNKLIGPSPLCLCGGDKTITAGEYNLKIVPNEKSLDSFVLKVKINPNVLTAVDRTFLPGALASFYTLMLEKTKENDPQIFVSSIPDASLVTINGESEGVTPLYIKSLPISEHEIEIEKPGFAKKTIRVKAVAGFKLILNTILGTEATAQEIEQVASASAEIIPTAAPTPKGPQVVINQTPTGFLRVRSNPSVAGAEIGQVKPGEIYPLADENGDWFQIQLLDGTKGWISATYATKQ